MRTQAYNNFWQRIHQAAKAKEFPLRVMFELTYRCNFKCRHCYVPMSYRKKRELKTKEVFFVLEQLKDIGCFYLGFTGGEPFIRKDIIDILWHAKKKGFEIIIYSNGSLIDKKIADELSYLRPNKVDITIPAMSKDAFERITEMPYSHRKVFGAIDLLSKRGIRLGFKTCVLKENESEIEEIEDFAASLGALHRLDDKLSPRLDGSKEPYRYRGVLNANYRESNANLREYIDANSRECLNDDISVNSRAIPACRQARSENSRLFKCGVGISQAAITPQGELKMCLMIDYPKYKILDKEVVSRKSYVVSSKLGAGTQSMNLKEAWNSLKELVASIKPDENYKCDKCKLEPFCKWCPARGWLYNRKFTSCEPENRQWAEDRRR